MGMVVYENDLKGQKGFDEKEQLVTYSFKYKFQEFLNTGKYRAKILVYRKPKRKAKSKLQALKCLEFKVDYLDLDNLDFDL